MISTSSDKALKDDLKTTSGLHIGKMSYRAHCSAELWPSPSFPGSLLLKAKIGVRNKTWAGLQVPSCRQGWWPAQPSLDSSPGAAPPPLPEAKEVGEMEPLHHTGHELCWPCFPSKSRGRLEDSHRKKILSFKSCTWRLINPYICAIL